MTQTAAAPAAQATGSARPCLCESFARVTERAALASARWLALNRRTFRATGRMMEKYDVVDPAREAGGGEYPTQDGFGWTNGVALALAAEKP